MAYDVKDRYLVLFGGLFPKGSTLADTWIFRSGNWSQLSPSYSANAVIGASLVYDPSIGALVLFAGQYGGVAGQADTWTFSGTDWSRLNISYTPAARSFVAVGFDPEANGVLAFGGYQWWSKSAFVDETWLLA